MKCFHNSIALLLAEYSKQRHHPKLKRPVKTQTYELVTWFLEI